MRAYNNIVGHMIYKGECIPKAAERLWTGDDFEINSDIFTMFVLGMVCELVCYSSIHHRGQSGLKWEVSYCTYIPKVSLMEV
jgi:hypothetical protein